MAGLNDLVSDIKQEAVSLPPWYTQAQQDVANQAKTAMSNVPALSSTPAAGVISDMMGPNNAFNQGQNALNTIASGAANPWMQNASGQTVGDPNTAMGGLFNAQTDYLNQIMPNVTAAPTAGAIGSGQFGSLRGMTAAQKARGDAFSDLAQKQMTAALQNQQTGVSAGTGLGQTGFQEAQSAAALTDLQNKYPFTGALNYGNIINSMKVPETRQTQVQYSPLSQVTGLMNVVGGGSFGTGASGGLDLNKLYETTKNVYADVSDWWNNSGGITNNSDGSYTTSDGNTIGGDGYSNLF